MVLAFGHLHHKSHATRQRTNTIHTHTEESVESQHKRVVCWSVTYLCSIAAYKNTRRVYIAMDWYPWLGRPTQNDMFRLRCCGECAVLFKVKNLDFVFTWLSFCAYRKRVGPIDRRCWPLRDQTKMNTEKGICWYLCLLRFANIQEHPSDIFWCVDSYLSHNRIPLNIDVVFFVYTYTFSRRAKG